MPTLPILLLRCGVGTILYHPRRYTSVYDEVNDELHEVRGRRVWYSPPIELIVGS